MLQKLQNIFTLFLAITELRGKLNIWSNSIKLILIKLFSRLGSAPYSRIRGSRNWRHRVCDVHVFINGHEHNMQNLKERLDNKLLEGLLVSC